MVVQISTHTSFNAKKKIVLTNNKMLLLLKIENHGYDR